MTKDQRANTRDCDRSQVKSDLSKKSSSSASAPSVNAPFNLRGERKGVLI